MSGQLRWPHECSESKINHFPLKEPRAASKLNVKNPNGRLVEVVTVDGCAIQGEALKCDYLVVGKDPSLELFVELKGSDVKHACRQLENSMRILSRNPCSQRTCFIVSTRVPVTEINVIAKFKKLFKENYNSDLIVRNGQPEFVIP